MISIFDVFKIGLGPSSSHTVGPMKAAAEFTKNLMQNTDYKNVSRIAVEVYGSLALTGDGHGTFDAILLGLEGSLPDSIDLSTIKTRLESINADGAIHLPDQRTIHFEVARDMVIRVEESLPLHPNGLRFTSYDDQEHKITSQIYYSIGGGFIVTEEEYSKENSQSITVPYPFHNAHSLFEQCKTHQLSIAEVILANEVALANETLNDKSIAAIKQQILYIAQIMFDCIDRGLVTEGFLPGGLHVVRRAPKLAEKLRQLSQANLVNSHLWPMVYAMAVNEENAAGGRVVTAPTNGAAGIVPSVLNYYRHFHPQSNEDGMVDFLLTAGAIGMLYKMNASISGADVGCQGEVGVACSMAAGAFSAISGGTIPQIENAAEMAMEHHLGLTCDPVAGLVQIPCIERNGIAAEKAIKLGTLSLLEDGLSKKVTLDMVIKTMYQTGKDMKSTYKETSLAGLAVTLKRKAVAVSVSVIEC